MRRVVGGVDELGAGGGACGAASSCAAADAASTTQAPEIIIAHRIVAHRLPWSTT